MKLGLKPDSGKYGSRLLQELLKEREGIPKQEDLVLNITILS